MPHRTLTVTGSHLPVSPLGTDYLTVKRLSGREAINELFEYTLELRTRDDNQRSAVAVQANMSAANVKRSGRNQYGNPVGGFAGMEGFVSKATADQGGSPGSNWDLASIIGTPLRVAIECDGKVDGSSFGVDMVRQIGAVLPARIGAFTRYLHGLVVRAEYSGVEGRSAWYSLTVRPWAWLLTQTNRYRIFQQRSPIDTIAEVLAAYPYRVEWRLSQSYPRLDYQVQYDESDWDFVRRLCAEYGLSFWFEHSEQEHVLVIADSLSAFVPMDSAAYQTVFCYPPDLKLQEEYVHRFDPSFQHTVGQVVLSDFVFKSPTADLSVAAQSPAVTAWDDLTLYDWQQGDFVAGEGEAKVERALQALRQHAQRCVGAGNLRGLQTGRTFTLANHPSEAANRAWLVLGQELTLAEIATESQGARGLVRRCALRCRRIRCRCCLSRARSRWRRCKRRRWSVRLGGRCGQMRLGG